MTAYNLSLREIENSFKTNLAKGLSKEEAKARLKEFGLNSLRFSNRDGILKLFIEQIKNPIVLLLLGTSVIAMLTGEVVESVLIISIVLFMAVIGVILEHTAGNALEKLKNLSSTLTMVMRGGKVLTLSTTEIVPGDVLHLQEGDKVPADARLVFANELQTDESILTGESLPASKNIDVIKSKNLTLGDQTNMIFSGTFIVEGNCNAVVISTGMHTELGKIAEQLAESEAKQTPLQVQLEKLSKLILTLTLIICTAILILGVYRGQTIIESLIQSLALAISFVPEGLSAVMTVTLAIGVREMVKKNVIIKRLIAAEGLGSISILATDKTGTITTGKMSVEKLWSFNNEIPVDGFQATSPIESKIIDILRYCNNSKGATENAFIKFLQKNGVEFDIKSRVHEHRFSSFMKRMTVLHKHQGNLTGYSKGAPDYLIPLCTQYIDIQDHQYKKLDATKREDIIKQFEQLAAQGYRVLSLAIRDFPKDHKFGDRDSDESDLVFVALIGLMDPIQDQVKITVEKLRLAGIRPIMITGDHQEIAKTIAFNAGIVTSMREQVITGHELEEYFTGKGKLTERDIVATSVFARVTPDHKNKLIDIFHKQGKNIAMAGDGVNDAVAIRKADIGIGVVNATDIVKEVSDVVITGDYSALGNAVEVGRLIMFRTRLYLHFLLSGNVCQVVVFILAYVAGLPVPLTPISLLLINLLTDAAPAMSMAVEKGKDNLMKEKPRKFNEGIINKMMWRSITIQGIFSSIYLFAIFYLTLPYGEAFAQTSAFVGYIFHDLLRAVTARSFKVPFWQYGIFSNMFNVLSIAFALIAMGLIVYVFHGAFGMTPLPVKMLLILFVTSLIFPVLEEIIKFRNKIDFAKS